MKFDLKKTYLVITLSRAVAVLSNFVLVSVLVKELNVQSYGFYALLISMINWIYFFDLGINKGLKNLITNNFEKNKIQNLQNILNTTILTSILFFVLLVIPIILLSQNILDYLENRTKIDESQLFKTSVVFLLVAGVKFVGNSINQVALSIHQSHRVALATTALSVLTLSTVLILVFFFENNISVFTVFLIELFSSIIIILALLLFVLLKLRVSLNPLRYFKIEIITGVLKDSLLLFLIQLGNLILISSDRFLVLSLVEGTENIAKYDFGYKVFGLILMPFSVISRPLWASFASAKINKDYAWLKKSLFQLGLYVLVSGIILFIIYFWFDSILYYWIGEILQIEDTMKAAFAGLFFFFLLTGVNHDFLMGFGNYSSYLICLIIAVIIKVSYLIVKHTLFETTTTTIINSTFIGYFTLAVFTTLITTRIVYNKET